MPTCTQPKRRQEATHSIFRRGEGSSPPSGLSNTSMGVKTMIKVIVMVTLDHVPIVPSRDVSADLAISARSGTSWKTLSMSAPATTRLVSPRWKNEQDRLGGHGQDNTL